MIAYLFAGQGSQYIGMGKDLYESFPQAKEVFDKADKALGFSLSGLCFDGPQGELIKTQNCQPAILTMTIAAFVAFNSSFIPHPSSVSYVAGLSLGEYSALVAAQAISFEDAVCLVRRRGSFMEEEAAKTSGKMASVLGMDLPVLREICQETKAEIANVNCPGQIVISGGAAEVEAAVRLAEEKGAKRAIFLEVSGAFHSSYMKPASEKLAQELKNFKISDPKIPVISNVTGVALNSAQEIKEDLVRQVYTGVLWEDSMLFILAAGVKNFVEFGPGKVLKGLMRRISAEAEVLNIEKKEDILK